MKNKSFYYFIIVFLLLFTTGSVIFCQHTGLSPLKTPSDRQVEQIIQELKVDSNKKFTLKTSEGYPDVDIFSNHGWAYASWETARLKGKIRDGSVLVHLDSHYDNQGMQGVVARPAAVEEARPIEYGLVNFIAPAAAYGLIDEIYFVLNPKYLQAVEFNPRTEKRFIARFKDNRGMEAVQWVATDRESKPTPEEAIHEILQGKTGNYSKEEIKIIEIRGPVTLHFDMFVDQLPDFSGETRPIILDIDEDYFFLVASIKQNMIDANTFKQGYYVQEKDNPYYDRKAKQSVDNDIIYAVNQLTKKHLKPGIITIAVSPWYVFEPSIHQISQRLIAYFEEASLIKYLKKDDDAIITNVFKKIPVGIPRIVEARKAFQNGSYDQALRLADLAIKENRGEALRQRSRALIRSPLVDQNITESCCRWSTDIPSPVFTLGQKELNAVAEAHFIKAKIYSAEGKLEESIKQFMTIMTEYENAFIIISEYEKRGWTVRSNQSKEDLSFYGETSSYHTNQWVQAKMAALENSLNVYAAYLMNNERYQPARFYTGTANMFTKKEIKTFLKKISKNGRQDFAIKMQGFSGGKTDSNKRQSEKAKMLIFAMALEDFISLETKRYQKGENLFQE
jgi:hypothetical protein